MMWIEKIICQIFVETPSGNVQLCVDFLTLTYFLSIY